MVCTALALLVAIIPAEVAGGVTPAESIAEILRQFTGSAEYAESSALELDVPDRATRGESVPLTLRAPVRGVRAAWLFVEGADDPLALHLTLSDAVAPEFRTAVRVCRTGRIVAVVETDRGLIGTDRLVYLGARARCSHSAAAAATSKPLKMAVKLRRKGDRVRLRTRIDPPPAPGTRLLSFSLHHGQTTIFEAQAGASLTSTAPLELAFTAPPGAYLHLRWTDDRQGSGEHSLHLR